VRLERSQSVRLRNKLQHSLSVHEVMEMKKEIDELRLKLAQANSENSVSEAANSTATSAQPWGAGAQYPPNF